jgi:hypothetical protein
MISDTKNIVDALHSLRPGAQWVLNGETYDGLVWHDTVQTKPTQAEIFNEIQRLQVEWDSNLYQRVREPLYPKIQDQLDMLWHAIDSGTLDQTSTFYTTIKEIKDANPKP